VRGVKAVMQIDESDAEAAASDPAKIIDQRVANRIRERRQRVGMTQQKLAQMIGVAFQQAHKYERGLSRVSAGRLYRIAEVLDAPIGYFFSTGEDAPEAIAERSDGASHGK
jgi:transcriptional regulator with XRE-family HTH domain